MTWDVVLVHADVDIERARALYAALDGAVVVGARRCRPRPPATDADPVAPGEEPPAPASLTVVLVPGRAHAPWIAQSGVRAVITRGPAERILAVPVDDGPLPDVLAGRAAVRWDSAAQVAGEVLARLRRLHAEGALPDAEGTDPAPRRARWPLLVAVLVGGLALVGGVVAAQDTLCEGFLRRNCRAWGVGHVPTEQEDTMWAAIKSPNDCSALRRFQTRFPESPYAPRVAERLAGVTEEERWFAATRLPSIALSLPRDARFPTEEAARADAEHKSTVEAERLCSNIPDTRFERADTRVDTLVCSETDGAWGCAWQGWADCVAARRSVKEVCP